MKRLLLVVLFACAFYVPAMDAQAEPFASIYSGAAISHDSETSLETRPPASVESFNADIEYNPGFLVGGNAGIWLNNLNLPFVGLMVDFNASFPDYEKLASVTANTLFTNMDGYPLNGDVSVYQTTANLIFRVPTGPIRPYIGGGGGVYTMDVNDGTVSFPAPAGDLPVTGDSDTTGGWQVLGGVDVPLTMIHDNLSAFVEYRYTAAKFELENTVRFPMPVGSVKYSTEIDYNASLVFGGVTWHFN
jgi:opacity protein-like surface antigen